MEVPILFLWAWGFFREINQHLSLPWNFLTHGFLDPSASEIT